MTLRALGYVGVRAQSVDDWIDYGTRFLGMQLAGRSRSAAAFRMDERQHRLSVYEGDDAASAFFGWEVADGAALDAVGARLESARTPVARATRAFADERGVKDLIAFDDPMGNRIEVFHGALDAATPFSPGRAISGFRTGSLGMGHVVLTVEHIDDAIRFYRDVLGFRLSDYTLQPFNAYFFHINPRHHSLALIETGRNGLHHLMIELFSLDDVGQAYDLAAGEQDRIGATLGRHTNDFMTSFYACTPSGFLVEYGWGGRSIDPAAWQPHQCEWGPSLWGHDRTWLAPEPRAEARRLRLAAAASGLRQPVQVLPGNHDIMVNEGFGGWPKGGSKVGRDE